MTVAYQVETNRRRRLEIIKKKHKSFFGQYLTPNAIAKFMSCLALKYGNIEESFTILDPGAGQGILCSALTEEIRRKNIKSKIIIDAYEIDNSILTDLENHLNLLKNENDVEFNLIKQDYIESLTYEIGWGRNKKYSHIIMNPPYKKLNTNSPSHRHLREVGIETVNFYSAFVAIGLMSLKQKGVLVAIIPRSFCNGKYFLPFRKQILKTAEIRQIHSFHSRTESFKEESVLQENIIIAMQKKEKKDNDIIISYSSNRNLEDYEERKFHFHEIINPTDKELYINLPPIDGTVKLDYGFFTALEDLNVKVSTGPVVDFRMKEKLTNDISNKATPLIYPVHLKNGSINWPVNSKKPNAIILDDSESKKISFKCGFYILVKRFSSKEEKRRIWPTLITDKDLEGRDFTIENHLNVFHFDKKGIDKKLAIGLFIFLNTTYIDQVFRRFSGHTQVNATDLRNLKYPSYSQLTRMADISVEDENKSYDEIINMVV